MQARFFFARLDFRLILVFTAISVAQTPTNRAGNTPEYTFEVVNRFPHDSTAFTQGFAYHGGYFYEGTGRNGKSSLRQIRPETGEIVRRVDLPQEFFGEGIAVLGNQIFQL